MYHSVPQGHAPGVHCGTRGAPPGMVQHAGHPGTAQERASGLKAACRGPGGRQSQAVTRPGVTVSSAVLARYAVPAKGGNSEWLDRIQVQAAQGRLSVQDLVGLSLRRASLRIRPDGTDGTGRDGRDGRTGRNGTELTRGPPECTVVRKKVQLAAPDDELRWNPESG